MITKKSDAFCVFTKRIIVTVALMIPGSSLPLYGAGVTGLRLVYLNGMDISTARGQQLKKVDVQITENGDIYIVAPHYQVHEEDSYVPLSQFTQGVNTPKHTAPGSSQALAPSTTESQNPIGPLVSKPGEPLSPPAASQSTKGTLPPGPKDEDLEPPSSDQDSADPLTTESPTSPAAPGSKGPSGQPLAQAGSPAKPNNAAKPTEAGDKSTSPTPSTGGGTPPAPQE